MGTGQEMSIANKYIIIKVLKVKFTQNETLTLFTHQRVSMMVELSL